MIGSMSSDDAEIFLCGLTTSTTPPIRTTSAPWAHQSPPLVHRGMLVSIKCRHCCLTISLGEASGSEGLDS